MDAPSFPRRSCRNLDQINPDRISFVFQVMEDAFVQWTRRPLTRWIPTVREVSAALRPAQSQQLIEAFYLLAIERIEGPPEVLLHALQLILLRYMFERGYTAQDGQVHTGRLPCRKRRQVSEIFGLR